MMENKRRSGSKASHSRQAGAMRTILVIILSVILIAAIVIVSPLGEMVFGTQLNDLLSCSKSDSADRDIISALKQQESAIAPSTAAPSPSEKSHKVISVESIPYYILQMSAFTNQADAEKHAAEIRQLGAGGVVFTEGNICRVFAAAYLDEASLTKVHSQVRADGFEATPYITEKKVLKLTLDGDPDAIAVVQKALDLLNDIPKAMCTLCLSYDKGEVDESGVLKELKDMLSLCRDRIDSVNSSVKISTISPIVQLLKKYEESISTFLDEHDSIETGSMSGDLKHLQLTLIIDYILFFNQE